MVSNTNNRTLGVFLSEGAGFGLWKKIGSFERETAIYFKLVKTNWNVIFFTYDKKDVDEVLPEGISVSVIPFGIINHRLIAIRQIVVPFFLWGSGKKCEALVTNQAHNGGWIAVLAAKIWGVKVIARCGYVYGEYLETVKINGLRHALRRCMEKWTLQHADKCMIPTRELVNWVIRNYKADNSKIYLLPNFVNIDQFKPIENQEYDFDIICIGRLAIEKRHLQILEAIKEISLKKVLFIGSGSLKSKLMEKAAKEKIHLRIIDRVENTELPGYLNRSKLFVLASEWEGHPKALIEAMACGCVCIGADRPGINNMIQHNATGILFDSTAQGLRKAIFAISNNDELAQKIKINARTFIIQNMSFNKIFADYKNVLSSL